MIHKYREPFEVEIEISNSKNKLNTRWQVHCHVALMSDNIDNGAEIDCTLFVFHSKTLYSQPINGWKFSAYSPYKQGRFFVVPNSLRHKSLDFHGVVISLSPFTRFYQCLVGRLKTSSPRLTVVCTLELSTGSSLAYRKQVPSRSSISVVRLSLSYIAIHTTVILRITPIWATLRQAKDSVDPIQTGSPGEQMPRRCRSGQCLVVSFYQSCICQHAYSKLTATNKDMARMLEPFEIC